MNASAARLVEGDERKAAGYQEQVRWLASLMRVSVMKERVYVCKWGVDEGCSSGVTVGCTSHHRVTVGCACDKYPRYEVWGSGLSCSHMAST